MARRSIDIEFTSLMVPRLVAYARGRGFEVEPLLRQYGIPDEVATLAEYRCTLAAFRQLCDALASGLSDPLFGVHAANLIRRGTFGLVEFAARSAGSIRQGLEPLVRYCTLINDVVDYQVDHQPDGSSIEFHVPSDPEGLGRYGNEHVVAVLIAIGHQLAGRPWAPVRVWFSHVEHDAAWKLYNELGVDDVRFGRAKSGLHIPREVLDAPIPTADPALFEVLQRHAQRLVPERKQNVDPFMAALREKLQQALRDGQPHVERVAEMLRMSGRTLQRRLLDHGTSFAAVLDEVRESSARKLLQDPMRPLAEVAFVLGYSELRAFIRAFKRWTGLTPGQYRRTARV